MCRIYGQFSPGEYVRNTKCEKLTLYMADFPCNICPLITQKDILHLPLLTLHRTGSNFTYLLTFIMKKDLCRNLWPLRWLWGDRENKSLPTESRVKDLSLSFMFTPFLFHVIAMLCVKLSKAQLLSKSKLEEINIQLCVPSLHLKVANCKLSELWSFNKIKLCS